MKRKRIIYFGYVAYVLCDKKCNKAWGINSRPKVQLSADVDDYEYLSDNELGDAPKDPRTYEGGIGKPTSPRQFPNKWCVRECERCVMTPPNFPDAGLTLPDFTGRHKNIHI